MKINSKFHVLVIFMTGLIFSIPFVSLAQRNSIQAEAVAAAELDAETNTNTSLWFFIGCLGGLLGLVYSNFDTPTVPASRLMGKSPEYVAFYSDAYVLKAKKLQTDSAVRGCITNAAASVGLSCLVLGCMGLGGLGAVADEL